MPIEVKFHMEHALDQTTLTFNVPITTAADEKYCEIFPNFQKKGMIFRENRALFVIFEKAAKFEMFVCCKL